MSNVCRKLVDELWENEKSRPTNNLPGIYAIGIIWKKDEETIYVGRSKNLRKRLSQHFQTSRRELQSINKFLQNPRNRAKYTFVVKWVIEEKQKQKEGEYLECMTHLLGYKPRFNLRRGDRSKGRK